MSKFLKINTITELFKLMELPGPKHPLIAVVNFETLLKEYFTKEIQKEKGVPTMQYFADNLYYSPNYLNGLIRKATDKSVLEHIHLEIINIAKTRLLNSDQSVSEIAFDLGFEYSQYFSRLFKKKTGVTPNEYRKTA